MKRSKTFRLSEAAIATLVEQAEELHISQTAALELLLGKYFLGLPLSPAILDNASESKTAAWRTYQRKFPDGKLADPGFAQQTYEHGFTAGYYAWKDYVHPNPLRISASLGWGQFWLKYEPRLQANPQLSVAQVFCGGFNDGWNVGHG